ncbi:MAG: cytochrome c5 family protein [Pseudomonadales bacterium]|nr:cytochrome c5 family protein [Pseudomonadales bacterium]
MKLSTIIILFVTLAACSNSMQQQEIAANLSFFANDQANADVMGKWSRSCALCHVSGVADAPLVGDTAEWRRRFAQGEDKIIENVLQGINSMPPLGYCMACEISDFRAIIGFMAGTNQ